MKEIEIQEKYQELLNDNNFKELNKKIKQQSDTPNIFKILKVDNLEIRHSNFLAWLLDPNENHGLGKLFLIEFLSGILATEKVIERDKINVDELNFINVQVKREDQSIDLLIIFDTLVICIENKVDAKDGPGQLIKYFNIVEKEYSKKKRFYVYLTLNGERPANQPEGEPYIQYSHINIVESLDCILKMHEGKLNSKVNQYISDYVTVLKRKLMIDNKLNTLAVEIYKNNKEIIDFVNKNKAVIVDNLHSIFREMISESNWDEGSESNNSVRFITPKLKEAIPNSGNEEFNNESFIFEIFFNKKNLQLMTKLPPGNEELRKLLFESLNGLGALREPRVMHTWINHDWYNLEIAKMDFIGADREKIRGKLVNDWARIKEIVNHIEEKLLGHKEDLQKCSD